MGRGKHWPLPSTIDLGYHKIRIELWTKAQRRKELEEDNDPMVDHPAFELPGGWFDPTEELIVVGKELSMMEKRWVLLHELGHMCLDLRDQYERKQR